MLNFMVTGQLPGTSIQINFMQVLVGFAILFVGLGTTLFVRRVLYNHTPRELVLTPQQW